MVHRHRPLRHRIERVARRVGGLRLERRVVEGQRVEVGLDAFTQVIRRLLAAALALRREPEALQEFRVDVDHYGIVVAPQPRALRPCHVALVPVAHVLVFGRHRVVEDAVVLRVHLPLVGVGLAAHRLLATLAAPPGQEAHARARCGFVVDDEVGVVAELARSVGLDESGELQPRRQFHQHLLERPALTGRRQHRDAHGVDRPVELGDRPVQHRHAVVPLQVAGVGQHQVGVGRHLRLEGVANDQERDPVLAVFALVVEHFADLGRVHRRVPRHVRHEDQQRVDTVRIAAPSVGDDVVHQPVRRQRMLPRKALVDAHRASLGIDEEIVGALGPAERRAGERRVRLHGLGSFRWARIRWHRARVRRLVTKAAGAIDRSQQRHQDRQRADGVKAVRMRGQPAHCMKGHRIALDRVMPLAPAVGPGDRQLDLLVARGDAHLVRQAADRAGRDAGDAVGPFGGVRLDAILQQLEGRHRGRAVGKLEVAEQSRVGAFGVIGDGGVAKPVPPEEVGRPQRVADVGLRLAQHHAEVVAVAVLVHQLAGVGVARQELAVVQAERDDLVDQRQQQRAVGAGLDRHPLVGDRRVAGAHRVDRDEAPARRA